MEKGREDDGQDQQKQGKMKMFEKQMGNPQEPPPHYNCPRCNSSHTKFCYFNNYSVTQPRYMCKTCRRYWTHGGSLRNVPYGGGSRRGKREKPSSSSNGEGSSRWSIPLPSSKPLHMMSKLSSMVSLLSTSVGSLLPSNQPMDASSSTKMPMNSLVYSSDGGFVSMSSLGSTPPQGINRPLRIGGNQMGGGGISGFGNMSILQDLNGFGMVRTQQQPQMPQVPQPNNFQNRNNRGKEPMYPSNQSFYGSTKPMGPTWNQIFNNNNNNHMIASSSTFWNSSIDNAANTSNDSAPGSSVDPNEWPDDLPDFDPPEI